MVGLFVLVSTAEKPFEEEVKYLTNAEDDADCRSSYHEVGENFLLGWPCDVTIHDVGAGIDISTLDKPRHVKAVPHRMQDI